MSAVAQTVSAPGRRAAARGRRHGAAVVATGRADDREDREQRHQRSDASARIRVSPFSAGRERSGVPGCTIGSPHRGAQRNQVLRTSRPQGRVAPGKYFAEDHLGRCPSSSMAPSASSSAASRSVAGPNHHHVVVAGVLGRAHQQPGRYSIAAHAAASVSATASSRSVREERRYALARRREPAEPGARPSTASRVHAVTGPRAPRPRRRRPRPSRADRGRRRPCRHTTAALRAEEDPRGRRARHGSPSAGDRRTSTRRSSTGAVPASHAVRVHPSARSEPPRDRPSELHVEPDQPAARVAVRVRRAGPARAHRQHPVGAQRQSRRARPERHPSPGIGSVQMDLGIRRQRAVCVDRVRGGQPLERRRGGQTLSIASRVSAPERIARSSSPPASHPSAANTPGGTA